MEPAVALAAHRDEYGLADEMQLEQT